MRRNVLIALAVLKGQPMRFVAETYRISPPRVAEIFWTEVNKVARRMPLVREALEGAPATHQLGIARANSAAIAAALTYQEGGDGTGPRN